jgi:hypothetical protein
LFNLDGSADGHRVNLVSSLRMATQRKQREAEIELEYAIRNKRVGEVKRLISEGVDPNAVGEKTGNFKYALTALCQAVASAGFEISPAAAEFRYALQDLLVKEIPSEREATVEIIRVLLAAGADPNRATFSRTPLSLAVHNQDIEVATMLLDAGASATGECWSPLSKLPKPKGSLAFFCNAIHLAAEKGRLDLVKLLIGRGADPSVVDHEGKTALQIARERGHVEVVQRLEALKGERREK